MTTTVFKLTIPTSLKPEFIYDNEVLITVPVGPMPPMFTEEFCEKSKEIFTSEREYTDFVEQVENLINHKVITRLLRVEYKR
jgi:hypothetical protein